MEGFKLRRADLSSQIENLEKNCSTDALDWKKDSAFLKMRLAGVEGLIGEIQIELDSWAQLQEEESLVLKKIQEKIIHYSHE